MSTVTAYDTIKAHLVSEFGSTYAVRDFEEIEVALQQGEDPWFAVEDSPSEQELRSVGTPDQNWVDDTGFIDIHLFVSVSGGLSPARTVLGQVRDAFNFKYLTVPAGEQLRILSTSAPEPGLYHDGLWHNMSIAIEFRHTYAAATAAE